MKRVLIIGTGGTIASTKGPQGLSPALSADKLLEFIPEVFDLCAINTLQILNIDSTNMRPEHWRQIAAAIWNNYDLYDGFVITHGTDTMAYTAAVLSYMIQNSEKPIVLTGSQKPMDTADTDARRNLTDAIRFACENTGGVYIVFDGSVINGCRAVKVRTKSSHAFESVNCPVAASIDETGIRYNPFYSFPHSDGKVKYYPSIAEDIFLLKLMPGVKSDIFSFIKGKYRGVVIESFGSGGVPFTGDESILTKINDLTDSGVVVVINTQCLFEGGDLNLYEVGQKLMQSQVIPAYDMTTEASLAKLIWALGQTCDFKEVRRMFLSPVNNDLTLNNPR